MADEASVPDSVRSLLLLSPADATPDFVPDASLIDLGDVSEDARPAALLLAHDATEALVAAGHRVYLHLPPLQSRQVREELLACLMPGVYGVSVPGLISLDQLTYVSTLLEELEPRVEITAGMTALGVWIDSARGLGIAAEVAAANDRLTWLGVDVEALAAESGFAADAAPADHARATVLFAAQAEGLPVVDGLSPADTESSTAEHVKALGLRGKLSRDAGAARRFQALFAAPAGAD